MTGPLRSADKDNSAIWPELWAAGQTHRDHIAQLLQHVAPRPGGSLCIWGSGRTTDLDLIGLKKHYAEIDLVDICLLYTSPSPRDLSTSRMPSSA